jgi:hypothetical protein
MTDDQRVLAISICLVVFFTLAIAFYFGIE